MKCIGLLIAMTFTLGSCASSFIQKDKAWSPAPQTPALMVHYSVVDRVSQSEGSSLLDLAKEVIEASQGKKSALDKAAEKSLARLKPLFSNYNMAIYFDAEAAKKAEEIEGIKKQDRSNNDRPEGKQGVFISAGDWLHPDTVEEPFHLRTALWDNFTKKYYQQMAQKTLKGDKKKVAVSMGMEFTTDTSYMFGWVCIASFRARVLNSAGKEVFVVSGTGQSSTRFFGGKNRYLTEACPEAAENSLAALSKVKVEKL